MSETCEIPLFNLPEEEIKELLSSVKTIAVVGMSKNPSKDSHHVAKYLASKGYKIIPINPTCETIEGHRCYPSLEAVPNEITIDLVDVFRPPEEVPSITDQAIRRSVKGLWLQEGIVHNASAEKAQKAGLKVVQGKCIMKALKAIHHEA